jgi:zinc transport system permease protein
MVIPVIAATRLAWSMASTIALAVTIGLSSVLVGLTVSYYADLPPGGTIVLAAVGAFVLTSAIDLVRSG